MVFINLGLSPRLKLAIFLASVSTNSVAYLARLLKAYRYSFKLLFSWVSFMNSVCLIAMRLGGM